MEANDNQFYGDFAKRVGVVLFEFQVLEANLRRYLEQVDALYSFILSPRLHCRPRSKARQLGDLARQYRRHTPRLELAERVVQLANDRNLVAHDVLRSLLEPDENRTVAEELQDLETIRLKVHRANDDVNADLDALFELGTHQIEDAEERLRKSARPHDPPPAES
jgi:hypothetical protein